MRFTTLTFLIALVAAKQVASPITSFAIGQADDVSNKEGVARSKWELDYTFALSPEQDHVDPGDFFTFDLDEKLNVADVDSYDFLVKDPQGVDIMRITNDGHHFTATYTDYVLDKNYQITGDFFLQASLNNEIVRETGPTTITTYTNKGDFSDEIIIKSVVQKDNVYKIAEREGTRIRWTIQVPASPYDRIKVVDKLDDNGTVYQSQEKLIAEMELKMFKGLTETFDYDTVDIVKDVSPYVKVTSFASDGFTLYLENVPQDDVTVQIVFWSDLQYRQDRYTNAMDWVLWEEGHGGPFPSDPSSAGSSASGEIGTHTGGAWSRSGTAKGGALWESPYSDNDLNAGGQGDGEGRKSSVILPPYREGEEPTSSAEPTITPTPTPASTSTEATTTEVSSTESSMESSYEPTPVPTTSVEKSEAPKTEEPTSEPFSTVESTMLEPNSELFSEPSSSVESTTELHSSTEASTTDEFTPAGSTTVMISSTEGPSSSTGEPSSSSLLETAEASSSILRTSSVPVISSASETTIPATSKKLSSAVEISSSEVSSADLSSTVEPSSSIPESSSSAEISTESSVVLLSSVESSSSVKPSSSVVSSTPLTSTAPSAFSFVNSTTPVPESTSAPVTILFSSSEPVHITGSESTTVTETTESVSVESSSSVGSSSALESTTESSTSTSSSTPSSDFPTPSSKSSTTLSSTIKATTDSSIVPSSEPTTETVSLFTELLSSMEPTSGKHGDSAFDPTSSSNTAPTTPNPCNVVESATISGTPTIVTSDFCQESSDSVSTAPISSDPISSDPFMVEHPVTVSGTPSVLTTDLSLTTISNPCIETEVAAVSGVEFTVFKDNCFSAPVSLVPSSSTPAAFVETITVSGKVSIVNKEECNVTSTVTVLAPITKTITHCDNESCTAIPVTLSAPPTHAMEIVTVIDDKTFTVTVCDDHIITTQTKPVTMTKTVCDKTKCVTLTQTEPTLTTVINRKTITLTVPTHETEVNTVTTVVDNKTLALTTVVYKTPTSLPSTPIKSVLTVSPENPKTETPGSVIGIPQSPIIPGTSEITSNSPVASSPAISGNTTIPRPFHTRKPSSKAGTLEFSRLALIPVIVFLM